MLATLTTTNPEWTTGRDKIHKAARQKTSRIEYAAALLEKKLPQISILMGRYVNAIQMKAVYNNLANTLLLPWLRGRKTPPQDSKEISVQEN